MQLIHRMVDLLMVLSQESEGITITALASKLQLPNSTVHRLLSVLKEQSFVYQSMDSKKYYLGYKVFTLTQNLSESNILVLTAKPLMEKLARELKMTITLNALSKDIISSIYYIESKDTVRFRIINGEAISNKASSAGKTICAYLTKEQQKYFYEKDNKVYTENTILTFADFEKELDLIRQRGYGLCDEELQLGVQGVASGLFNSNGQIVGALAYTGLKDSNALSPDKIELLVKTAKDITKLLSGQ